MQYVEDPEAWEPAPDSELPINVDVTPEDWKPEARPF